MEKGRIHLIGVCGVAMGSLAGMLKSSGWQVSGSDRQMYPPMSEKLAEWGIVAHEGFDPANLKDCNLIVVGNSVSRGNPELEYVLDNKIPYISMTRALADFFLKDKEVIAVCGTHGKTTTTSLIAHILDEAGLDPSYFIGGVPLNSGTNFQIGSGKYFVIEGDEYDSAFCEKYPKFINYRPYHTVITSLEFDHADIYNSLEEISTWFKHLINIIPQNGEIIYSAEYHSVKDVVAHAYGHKYSFGEKEADYSYQLINQEGKYSLLRIIGPDNFSMDFDTALIGRYNFANITAAVALTLKLGVSLDLIARGVKSFQGVARRQQLIYEGNNLYIYEDFAHHPTAIREVLEGFSLKFPDAEIYAIYEPRSATSRRSVLQGELPNAFVRAERILIKNPGLMEKIPVEERIDVSQVINELHQNGKNAGLFMDVDDIIEAALERDDSAKTRVIVIMSNGGFDGIYSKITAKAARKI